MRSRPAHAVVILPQKKKKRLMEMATVLLLAVTVCTCDTMHPG